MISYFHISQMHFSCDKLNQSVHLVNETLEDMEYQGYSGQEHRQTLLCPGDGLHCTKISVSHYFKSRSPEGHLGTQSLL